MLCEGVPQGTMLAPPECCQYRRARLNNKQRTGFLTFLYRRLPTEASSYNLKNIHGILVRN